VKIPLCLPILSTPVCVALVYVRGTSSSGFILYSPELRFFRSRSLVPLCDADSFFSPLRRSVATFPSVYFFSKVWAAGTILGAFAFSFCCNIRVSLRHIVVLLAFDCSINRLRFSQELEVAPFPHTHSPHGEAGRGIFPPSLLTNDTTRNSRESLLLAMLFLSPQGRRLH